MNAVDKDFQEWFAQFEIPINGHNYHKVSWMKEAWLAAAEKYQDRIEELEDLIANSDLWGRTCSRLTTKNKKLESENAKLVGCVEFYAHPVKVRVLDIGKEARQCLKELQIGAT